MKATGIKGRVKTGSPDVLCFVRSLADDLRLVGMRPRTVRRGGSVQLTYVARNVAPSDQVKIGRTIRSRQMWQQRDFIRAFERSHGRLLFIAGRELQIKRIKPKVRVCRTAADLAIHRYCRLTQTVPSGPRVGRRIAALVYDVGQRRRALMGAIMLASPLYSVSARDKFLGWSKQKRIKDAGLRRVMDLSLCMALPPYNHILAGKLMATLAGSETLSKEFGHRYRDRLLAIATTCATGLHCPIFNRIMIRPGGLYRRIGETTGYTAMIFSENTIGAARRLIRARRLAENCSMWNTTRILKTAMSYCGIKPEPLFQVGNHKGVYVALLDSRSRERLRIGRSLKQRDTITDTEAVDFWKRNILRRRLCQPEIVRKVRDHTFHTVRIGRKRRK